MRDGALVRRARQSIKNFLHTAANTDRHAALRVVLAVAETAPESALRREHASMREALNAAEAKLAELQGAAPALFAEVGDVFYHPRGDGDELAERDYFVFLGRVDELGGVCGRPPHGDEASAVRHAWLRRSEHGRWLAFRHICGEGFGLRVPARNGVLGAMVPMDCEALPAGWWFFVRKNASCFPNTEMVVPPRFCARFRRPSAEELRWVPLVRELS